VEEHEKIDQIDQSQQRPLNVAGHVIERNQIAFINIESDAKLREIMKKKCHNILSWKTDLES
jgi:hypothetical protein